MGLRVLRFPNSQIREDLPSVLGRIESAVAQAVPPSHLMGRGTGG
jgi:very-short-patch-repair endonuclease